LYGSILRVRLTVWLYTSLDPVLGVEISSPSSSGNHKAKATYDLYGVVALTVDTKSTGRYFQAMAQSGIDKIPPGPKLDALTAEKIFAKIARRKVARKSGEWLNPHIIRKNF
jgi:hypothetical protein